jgi:exodeoxyribonuclease VII large subunit
MTDMPDYDPVTGEIIEATKPNLGEQSVTELSHALKRTLEDRFGHVRVRGEITGYRGAHSSGHCYFSLKDDGAKLEAVIWRGAFSKLRSKLQEGLEVIATGKITSYPGKSNYQIIVENIEPAGVGALMALLEERKKKLSAEGLFDESRKQALPFLPKTIGIVTSPTGAVIRDILHRLNDRFPRHVIVWPVRVQGETAAAEVAAAIQGFNAMANKPDLIIVARGGGSLEDLWAFNEESVVRAAAGSHIPLISAIGHETDTTLIDYASDWRAPTPTAAAERAVPVRADLVAEIASLNARQKRTLGRIISDAQVRLRSAVRALPKPDDIFAFARQRLDANSANLPKALRANVQEHSLTLAKGVGRLSLKAIATRVPDFKRRLQDHDGRMRRALTQNITRRKDRLQAEAKLFNSLNYKSVLARGFAVIRDVKGQPLRAIAQTPPHAALEIEMADGRLNVVSTPKKLQGTLF